MSREDSPLPAIVVEWGLATAAYQVEGAVAEDGRGKSIWDTFCHLQPTRTKGANGDIACDHYQRLSTTATVAGLTSKSLSWTLNDNARGYSTGLHAPGRSSTNDQSEAGNSATEPWDFKPSQAGQIGISLNGDYYEPWDGADARDEQAAERRMEFHMGWFANPILYVVLPSFVVTFTNYKTLDRTPKKSALMLKQMFTERQGRTVT
ncbi:Glycoside hydrolase, family 1 [Metarhizium rileyi]|uniref:Glycoside hydrolase, family 1 n=1 Tax=Metarhizium rileyi (strain RCEF 4871) TaxID=1649241 RepID=A0A167JR92_METRR|nr:Glycoside hydrolase, family 1 [Metarhizium rileyi RCEF 4871]